MTDRENIYRGLSNGAWGYFFLNFDLNLNSVSIFPRFVGFLLLKSAIDALSGERRDLKLLRPLCVLLAGWSGIDWLLSWRGGDVDGHIIFLDLLVTAATLYLHFQFLTDMSAMAAQYEPEESDLDRRLLKQRSVYVLLVTAISLMTDLSQLLPWEGWTWAIGALAVVTCLDALCIMTDLFQLRRFAGKEEDAPKPQ